MNAEKQWETRLKPEVSTCDGIQEATQLNIAVKEEWLAKFVDRKKGPL